MIKLNVDFNPDDIPPNIKKYNKEVKDSLKEIAALVPNHKMDNFIKRLWGYFKPEIWKQQGCKCAYCEQLIPIGNSHLEHFRPKSKTHNEENTYITNEAYWWLVYDHRNYVVSCSTCNNQKGNRFPIVDEKTRVTAKNMESIVELDDHGYLGNEIPRIINPRYKNPKKHLVYRYTPNHVTPMVHIAPTDDAGNISIIVYDLNRSNTNKKSDKDPFPRKRGSVLKNFKDAIENYEGKKNDLLTYNIAQMKSTNANLQSEINSMESELNDIKVSMKENYLSYTAEFSGMCSFWLKNETSLENEFINVQT